MEFLKLDEFGEFGNTVALGCALGGNNEVRLKHMIVLLLLRYLPAAVYRRQGGGVTVRGCGAGVL